MNIAFAYSLAGIFGAIIGSFLNVVIHRAPALWGLIDPEDAPRGNLATPRSYCPSCRATLRFWQIIPILSYIGLQGRCAKCRVKIPPRYLLVELTGAAAAVMSLAVFGFTFAAFFASFFFFALITLAAIDWETGYLPDAITLPLIGAGLIAAAVGHFTPFPDAMIGAAAGYGALWAVAAGYERWRGRAGLGMGDAKLLAALGAWCGWAALPLIVFGAALIALGAVGLMRLRGADINNDTAIPFGPALALSGAAMLIANAKFSELAAYSMSRAAVIS